MTLGQARCCAVVAVVLALTGRSSAEPVPVRYLEGLTHGFLSLKTLAGRLLGSGDLIQTVRGDRVTSRLVLHYRDGSINDETTIYSQRKELLLLSDHLIQKGPAFKRPLEARMDRSTGLVTVRYTTDKGEQKIEEERMDFPPDLANGIMLALIKNVRPDALPESVSLIALTPTPRLVKVKFASAGLEPFSFSGSRRRANHYVLTIDIGGLTGLAAKVFDKQPPDSHVWILGGDAPAFVRAETPLAAGQEPSVLELSSPVWKAR